MPFPLPKASSFARRVTLSGAAADGNSRRGRTKLRPRRLIEARAARKFNSDKERRPQRRFAAPALTYVMRLAALFRCSNHKGNRLATLMIQGARAAYARLRHKVSPPNDFRPRSRRNLAPILGDGDFSMLRISAPRRLSSQSSLARGGSPMYLRMRRSH